MPEKILVLAVSGIGNAILQSPLIEALLNDGRFEVDVLFGTAAAAQVFAGRLAERNTHVLPKGVRQRLALLRRLRERRYDHSVACFPSNRIEFHLFAWLTGARSRIAHSYPKGRLRTLAFLSNRKIPARRELHDVEQNLALLAAFGISPERASRQLTFGLSAANRAAAQKFLDGHGLSGRPFVGIHAGCKLSERYRRWPSEHFVRLINALNESGLACVMFAGPDELEDTRDIHDRVQRRDLNVVAAGLPLGVVGAVIEKSVVFLSTDSGLGHVATAVGVETFAIFGPAQWTRTAPHGSRGHYIALHLPCSPCLKYPFDATHSRIDCPYTYRCLRELSPDTVLAALQAAAK